MKKGKTNTSDVCASNIIKFDAWWHIMEKYRLEGETFVIDDYDKLPAFSSFLPGLAGSYKISFCPYKILHIYIDVL